VYKVIKCLIATIASPQIAIDERHTPKLYSCFLESLLGRMPQQGPPPQQMQTGLNTPRYQQLPQLLQQQRQ
ncbi:hypothetical protein F5148DRAFT_1174567, partial [Russula earlei]